MFGIRHGLAAVLALVAVMLPVRGYNSVEPDNVSRAARHGIGTRDLTDMVDFLMQSSSSTSA